MEWEKVFPGYFSDNGLILRIYKEYTILFFMILTLQWIFHGGGCFVWGVFLEGKDFCGQQPKNVIDKEHIKFKMKLQGYRMALVTVQTLIEMYRLWVYASTYLNGYINLAV